MDVQVKDSEVSRRHSMIEVRAEGVMLVDLGATNGTWVGGERIDQVEISNQSEFTLGSTTLMLIVTTSTQH
jgi:pSer/pThr/pTyr-binding forkhead associated (FHA) protein